ncbi:putative mitochondrial protein, partial [Tanacetum coccineum]
KQVEYLGHVIYVEGVDTDQSKIQVIKVWPVPKNIKQLRDFLGLIGYYRRFIKNYALIGQPLIALLKKNAFGRNAKAEEAIMILTQATIEAQLLALPHFQSEFTIETHVSGTGLGTVLQQANALSRLLQSEEFNALITFEIEADLMTKVKENWTNNIDLHRLIQKLINDKGTSRKYNWKDAELRRKGKLVVASDVALRTQLMIVFYNETVGGHSSMQASFKKLGLLFYWKKMSKDMKNFVRRCDVCQRNKKNLEAYPGAPQLLPFPDNIWNDVSMNFVDGLPSSHGKTVIIVVVDRLTKYAYFFALSHPYIVVQVAQMFLDHLKKCKSEVTEMGTFPLYDEVGLIIVELQTVLLDRRMQKKGNKVVVYVLIQWTNGSVADAT